MRFILALGLVATATASMTSDFARNAAGVKEKAQKGTGGLRGGRDLARGGRAGRGHKVPRSNKRTAGKLDNVAPFRPGENYDEPPMSEEDVSDEEEKEEEEEAFEGESPEVDPTPTLPPREFYRGKEPKLVASKPGERPGRPGKSATPIEDEGYARGWGVQAKEKKAKEKKGHQKRDNPGRRDPSPPDPDPSEAQSSAHEANATGGYERPTLAKDKAPRQPRTKPDKGAPRGPREGDDGPRFGEKFGPEKRVKMAKEEKRGKPKKHGGRAGPPKDAAMRGWPPTPAPTFAAPSPPPSPEPTTVEPTTPAPVWAEEETEEGAEEGTEGLWPCPPDYNPSHTSYVAGDAIEMNGHVFVCQDPPHEEYCNVVELDDSWDDAAKELWYEAWDHAGPCEETEAKAADVAADEAAEETVEEGRDDVGALIGDEVAILDKTSTSAATAASGEDIPVEWTITDYTAGMTASVGDTAIFTWQGGEGAHNVFVHPSGDCTLDGASEVGVTSPASHTFTEAGTITFACDVFGGAHCYAGQILTFEVSEAPADAPAEDSAVAILDKTTTSAATTRTVTTTDAPVATEALVTITTTATATEAPDTRTTTTTTTSATATTTTAVTTTATTTTATTTEEDTTTTAGATEAASPVPTGYPTYAPTGPMPDCPPAFDPAATYAAGDMSEVREHIFECRDELHEPWCNVAEWDSSYISEQFPNAKDLWREAWVHVGPCAPVTLEEQMDIEALVEEIEAGEAWLEGGAVEAAPPV